MSVYFSKIHGNEALRQRIGESIAERSHSHAYIIEGPDGSGKMTLARSIAAALSCEDKAGDTLPCGECNSCKRIFSDNFPDVTVIDSAGKATMGVDTVRRLKDDVYLSATESDYKVYILSEADKLTVQAQNALLKVLEEPPDSVVFLLLCEDSKRLLTTVKSRAQTLRMQLFSPEELSEYLEKNSSDARTLKRTSAEKFGAMIEGADGRIGAALDLCDSKRLSEITAKREAVDAVISAVTGRATYSALYDAISSLPQKRAELSESLSMVIEALRDLILIKKSPTVSLCYYFERERALELSSLVSLKRLCDVETLIEGALDSVLKNANVNIIMTSLISDIKKCC